MLRRYTENNFIYKGVGLFKYVFHHLCEKKSLEGVFSLEAAWDELSVQFEIQLGLEKPFRSS